jgi:hypothetical protein
MESATLRLNAFHQIGGGASPARSVCGGAPGRFDAAQMSAVQALQEAQPQWAPRVQWTPRVQWGPSTEPQQEPEPEPEVEPVVAPIGLPRDATPERSSSPSATFTPSVGGSPAAAQQHNLSALADETAGAEDDSHRRAAGPGGWPGGGELALFAARQDMVLESRLQQQRHEINTERKEIMLELERSELEMERCR